MKRFRNGKIVATLGPATSDKAAISALFEAGADIFRMNFSHGAHEDHATRIGIIRELEAQFHRPIGIIADLQGPKLRVGEFADGALAAGVQLIPASLIAGGEGFIRISYAADEEVIHEGLRRLKAWLC